MLAELIVLYIMANEPHKDATLKVTCNTVTLDYGGKPQANKVPVIFWISGKKEKMWRYKIPMEVNSKGHIVLEPGDFWVEEVRTKKSLKLSIGKKLYEFNLKGTMKALQCD